MADTFGHVTDDQPPTLLERLTSVYGPDKAAAWLASGHVQVDGEKVTDPGLRTSAAWCLNP